MFGRRLFMFSLALALVVLCLSSWLLWPNSAITHENVRRIQKGMTLAEVEEILGGPARDDTSRRRSNAQKHVIEDATGTTHLWWSDTVCIAITLNRAGLVTTIDVSPVTPIERENAVAMLRRWLRL
jgi:hypothetical protein